VRRVVAALGSAAGGDGHVHGDGRRHRVRRPARGVTNMAVLAQFIIGLIFGLGLVVSGMSDPAKVLNFLDFAAIRTGGWDASLAFLMAGVPPAGVLGAQ